MIEIFYFLSDFWSMRKRNESKLFFDFLFLNFFFEKREKKDYFFQWCFSFKKKTTRNLNSSKGEKEFTSFSKLKKMFFLIRENEWLLGMFLFIFLGEKFVLFNCSFRFFLKNFFWKGKTCEKKKRTKKKSNEVFKMR